MSTVFITGAGTGVGKTYVTCGLIRALRAAGRKVAALKPVISGYDQTAIAGSDSGRILAAMGLAQTEDAAKEISPWRFREPLAPDMAAAREGRLIDFAALVRWSAGIRADAEFRIIEGVGGVLVPLDDSHTVLDWIRALDCPAVLVAGSYLGTLNHSLTALHVLRAADVAVSAIIVSESEEQPVPLAETVDALKRFSLGTQVIGLPRHGDAAGIAAALGWISG